MNLPAYMIDVGIQRDGYTFRLDPLSRVQIQQTYPDLPRVASVFISFDQHKDLEQLPLPIWQQLVQLLTGLSFERINELGGFSVFNPHTETVVYNSLMIYA